MLTVRPVQQTPTCSLPSTVPSGCSHAPQQKETMKQEFVCMCVFFFFAISFSHSSGFCPLLPPLPHFTVKKTQQQNTTTSSRQAVQTGCFCWVKQKNTHTHTRAPRHTHTETQRHTHTYLKVEPDATSPTELVQYLKKKKRRKRQRSSPDHFSGLEVCPPPRRSSKVFSAHTHAHSHTHAVSTHRKCKCGMGGTGRSDVTPGLLLLLLLHLRSRGTPRAQGGACGRDARAHTDTRAHRWRALDFLFIYLFIFYKNSSSLPGKS